MRRVARYQSWEPYCQSSCPLGNKIRDWLQLVKQRRTKEAWELLVSRNPFPSIMGRICYHFCESGCRRGLDDQAVAISQVERWLGDQAIMHGWSLPAPLVDRRDYALRSSLKILVVGAGPAGLSAAYQLARLGYQVVVWEKNHYLGGELQRTLPSYRLPADVAQRELMRVADYPGVQVLLDKSFTKLAEVREQFAAVLLATGAGVDRQLNLPSVGTWPTLPMSYFLERVNVGSFLPNLGHRLIVYGGGNSAVDAARVAKRLAVEEVIIVYHRSQECMPAFGEELTAALAEGIKLVTLRSIVQIEHNGVRLQINTLDENLKPLATGEYEFLQADSLIMALGQQPDLALYDDLDRAGSFLVADDRGRSSGIGVWAIGDLVGGSRNASTAIASGRLAAEDVHSWLSYPHDEKQISNDWFRTDGERVVDETVSGNEHLVCPERCAQGTAARVSLKAVGPELAVQSLQEVVGTIDDLEAIQESERCYSCGSCRGCGNCAASCPKAVIALDDLGYLKTIDEENCIGCGRCVRNCPCGVLHRVDDV